MEDFPRCSVKLIRQFPYKSAQTVLFFFKGCRIKSRLCLVSYHLLLFIVFSFCRNALIPLKAFLLYSISFNIPKTFAQYYICVCSGFYFCTLTSVYTVFSICISYLCLEKHCLAAPSERIGLYE